MKERGTISWELRKKLLKIFDYLFLAYTIDDAIDAFRKKFNIVIYNKAEPFVQPTGNKHKILYCFAVKKCYPNEPNGWNKREYLGESKWCENIYEAKRQAIKIALKYVQTSKSTKNT